MANHSADIVVKEDTVVLSGKEVPRCPATSKGSGERCRKPVSPGKGACYWHGGAGGGPKGKKSQGISDYSEQTLEGWRQTFRGLLEDPDLTSMRKDIAAQEIRMNEAWAALHDEDVAELRQWRDQVTKALYDLQRAWQTAAKTGDTKDLQAAVQALVTLRDDGAVVSREKLWAELSDAQDQKRRLLETELRMAQTSDKYLSKAEVVVVLTDLIHHLTSTIQDQDKLDDILHWFSRRVGSGQIIDGEARA